MQERWYESRDGEESTSQVARLDGTRRRRQGEKINITHRHFAADRQVLQERVAVAVGEVHS